MFTDESIFKPQFGRAVNLFLFARGRDIEEISAIVDAEYGVVYDHMVVVHDDVHSHNLRSAKRRFNRRVFLQP
jgi:hypothetical protein